MKKLLLILLCLPLIGFGQDNIILKDGEEISSKILRINPENIEYKKASNLQGPTYTLGKIDVFMIKYENGEQEVFSEKESYDKNSNNHDDVLKKLTKKNNIVYIESEDDGARKHATKALKSWGYWQITEEEESADFILRFIGHHGFNGWTTYAQFINPTDKAILKITKTHHDAWGAYHLINTKIGATKEVIEKEIKSIYY
tara:strand:- start:335 stop:934 length:600 start_codon:yes stop_codon:yes gene_type:complete